MALKAPQENDQVKLLSALELLMLFMLEQFFIDDDTRKEVANEIGGTTGIVESIEEKSQFDHFLFKAKNGLSYKIPTDSIAKINP